MSITYPMHSLRSLHTFGLDTSCERFTPFSSISEFKAQEITLPEQRILILGEGSNCVFVENFEGHVLKNNLVGIHVFEEVDKFVLKVGAGESWHGLVTFCIANAILGLENLALIPGTVGAAPIQNIGAYGVEVCRFIRSVEFIDLTNGRSQSLEHDECQFGYRESIFKQQLAGSCLITQVEFVIPKLWSPVIEYGELVSLQNPTAKNIFDKVVAIRRSKLPDPVIMGNAGSFFKNPVVALNVYDEIRQKWPDVPGFPGIDNQIKIPAAWLIDSLGFKGTKVGGIGCHPNHALVLTNDGTGTGEELLILAREIKHKVLTEFGVLLENEVRLMGNQGLITL